MTLTSVGARRAVPLHPTRKPFGNPVSGSSESDLNIQMGLIYLQTFAIVMLHSKGA